MRAVTKSKGHILVVERNPAHRTFAAAVLVSAGYWVVEAEDPWQAFSLCESMERPLHLLAAEVSPGRDLGGVELFRHLSVLRPGLKVLYLSSVPADSALRVELQSALDSYLSKPFTREDLLAKVARLLSPEHIGKGRIWANGRADWRPTGEPAPGV
jgi:CheY-like chemotaxis protein